MPTFVKVDVEGVEVSVLRGASKLMSDARPTFVMEIRRDERFADIEIVLRQHDYRMSELAGSRFIGDFW